MKLIIFLTRMILNKKKKKLGFVLLLTIALTAIVGGSAFLYTNKNSIDDSKVIKVVTSCNPVYIAALNICQGIEGVEVINLSQPSTGCLHDYQLTTGDMKVLSTADVLVISGLGMEGYLQDALEAYPNLKVLDTSAGIDPENLVMEEDEINSHVWMAVGCFQEQVEYFGDQMGVIDSANASLYEANAKAYVETIQTELYDKYVSQIKEYFGGRTVGVLHEAYAYIASECDLDVVADMDLDEERQVSAKETADLLDDINSNYATVVLAEEDYGSQMGKLIDESTMARTVYLKTLVHGQYNRDSYVEIMSENFELLLSVLMGR